MKKFFPIFTIVWPYITLFLIVVPQFVENDILDWMQSQLIFLQIVGIVLSVIGAIVYSKDPETLKWCRLMKLIHIPYYIAMFLLAIAIMFAFINPILIVLGLSMAFFVMISDFVLMICTSLYGLIFMFKHRKKSFYPLIVMEFIFCLDVIGACIAPSVEKRSSISNR